MHHISWSSFWSETSPLFVSVALWGTGETRALSVECTIDVVEEKNLIRWKSQFNIVSVTKSRQLRIRYSNKFKGSFLEYIRIHFQAGLLVMNSLFERILPSHCSFTTQHMLFLFCFVPFYTESNGMDGREEQGSKFCVCSYGLFSSSSSSQQCLWRSQREDISGGGGIIRKYRKEKIE